MLHIYVAFTREVIDDRCQLHPAHKLYKLLARLLGLGVSGGVGVEGGTPQRDSMRETTTVVDRHMG